MARFTDAENRSWNIRLTMDASQRVKDDTGVKLHKLIDDGCKPLQELVNDPLALLTVVWAVIRPQAQEKGVTLASFGESMIGDNVMAAADAFLEALADFFPNPEIRAGLRKMVAKNKVVMERVGKHAATKLDALDAEKMALGIIQEMDRKQAEMEAEMEARRTGRSSPGSAPGSSGSTPAPSPSAS